MREIIQHISGLAMIISFILVLGKAGASDCGAALETIFPSTFIYGGLMITSFCVWEATGGNE